MQWFRKLALVETYCKTTQLYKASVSRMHHFFFLLIFKTHHHNENGVRLLVRTVDYMDVWINECEGENLHHKIKEFCENLAAAKFALVEVEFFFISILLKFKRFGCRKFISRELAQTWRYYPPCFISKSWITICLRHVMVCTVWICWVFWDAVVCVADLSQLPLRFDICFSSSTHG